MQKLFAPFVALIVPLAFAGRPPVNLVADSVAGGDSPAVQSIGSSESAQPVSIVNWVIDENGNVRVSNQVRDQVIILGQHFTLPESPWASDWFETGRFTVMAIASDAEPSESCGITSRLVEWEWDPSLPPMRENAETMGGGSSRTFLVNIPIHGPRARLILTAPTDCPLSHVAVYLRAE